VVFALDGSTLRPLPIRVGVTDGSNTELVEGAVSEGTALVTDASDGSSARPASAPVPMGPGGPGGMPPGLGGGRAGRR
jgi:HlyD family secretion protein